MRRRLTPAVAGVPGIAKPSDATGQGAGLVQELERLAPLLKAEQKRDFLQRLVDAFESKGESFNAARALQRSKILFPNLVPSPPRAAGKPQVGLVKCPHCKNTVRADRLEHHFSRVHSTVRSPSPSRPVPTTTDVSATVDLTLYPFDESGKILCGDCHRRMLREQYLSHQCRPKRGPIVQGGAPGLGKRR